VSFVLLADSRASFEIEGREASAQPIGAVGKGGSPLMTMGVYAKAVTADKRNAQHAIGALFVEKGTESTA
jgi:hypothetical protein